MVQVSKPAVILKSKISITRECTLKDVNKKCEAVTIKICITYVTLNIRNSLRLMHKISTLQIYYRKF